MSFLDKALTAFVALTLAFMTAYKAFRAIQARFTISDGV